MQVKVTHPTDTSAKLVIIADTAAMQAIKDQVLIRLSDQVKLPGFRQGKAPLALVEKNVDQAALQTQFLETAVEQLYYQAISSEKLRPVGNPQIAMTKFVPFTTLEFEAEMPVIGDIKLPDYTKIKLAPKSVTITADDVKGVLASLTQRAAEKQPVERAAEDGDEVVLDFQGVDTKTKDPINGAEGKDYPLVLGSNAFIPGFEPNLIGMKAGGEKTFDIIFPKDYGVQALASKKVTFTVTVHTVHELVEPKLDEAFAATVGPFKSVQELKEDIKRQLTIERQQQADREYESELVQKISEKAKLTVPDVLIDEQVERLEQDERQNLVYRGQTWQEHLDQEGVTEAEHKAQKRPAAEERVRAGLVLAEVADQEQLSVTPDELDIRIEVLKGQYQDPKMQAELDKLENRQDIASRILTEKTLEKLKGYATK